MTYLWSDEYAYIVEGIPSMTSVDVWMKYDNAFYSDFDSRKKGLTAVQGTAVKNSALAASDEVGENEPASIIPVFVEVNRTYTRLVTGEANLGTASHGDTYADDFEGS